jgi:hypothetical protein
MRANAIDYQRAKQEQQPALKIAVLAALADLTWISCQKTSPSSNRN